MYCAAHCLIFHGMAATKSIAEERGFLRGFYTARGMQWPRACSRSLPGRRSFPMQRTTVKTVFLSLILASALPLAACGKDDTPTSPTQPGPPVSTPTPAPTPAPPTTPAPTPPTTPAPPSPQPTVTLTGFVANLARSGAGDLNISFRIDDSTIVRGGADTLVTFGGQSFGTDAVRP